MKTAVSIPDELFKTAEKTARRMGIPRSRLFAKALEEFIRNHTADGVTEKLNEVYSSFHGESDEILQTGLLSARDAVKNDAW